MLNPPKVLPIWRAWLLLALACWACVFAPAAQAFAPQLATGVAASGQKTRVWGFLADHTETRLETSPQVAGTHQEKPGFGYETASGRSEGSNSDPASLHKYNYASGNPVMGFDPSGHFTLTEMMQAVQSAGILMRMAIPALPAIQSAVYYRLVMFTLSQMQQAVAWGVLAGVGTLIDTDGDVGQAAVSAAMGFYFSGGTVPTRSARDEIIRSTVDVLRPHLRLVRQMDPAARIGFRGSLANGVKGEHKGVGVPFNENDFDVDAFIVSDKLAALFPPGARARWGNQINLGSNQNQIHDELSQAPNMGGLRQESGKRFSWRIFTTQEISTFQDGGDAPIFVE